MKQGKLIRRAVSAALAGCMMFTLSAPALAASTDALMQLSTAAKSAVNVLDEENGMTEETAYQMDLNNGNQVGNKVVQNFGIYVDDKPVTSENYQNLKSGRIVYDPEQKTLTAANRIKNLLKIRAPKTDVILNGGIGRGDLTIGQQDDPSVVGADDVTVTSDQYATIDGWAYINCTGKVNISSDEDMAVNGSLNISDSSEVILSADSSAVTGSANITSNGDVTIESTDGRAAQELTINKAQNVTITISDAERAVSEDTKIHDIADPFCDICADMVSQHIENFTAQVHGVCDPAVRGEKCAIRVKQLVDAQKIVTEQGFVEKALLEPCRGKITHRHSILSLVLRKNNVVNLTTLFSGN